MLFNLLVLARNNHIADVYFFLDVSLVVDEFRAQFLVHLNEISDQLVESFIESFSSDSLLLLSHFILHFKFVNLFVRLFFCQFECLRHFSYRGQLTLSRLLLKDDVHYLGLQLSRVHIGQYIVTVLLVDLDAERIKCEWLCQKFGIAFEHSLGLYRQLVLVDSVCYFFHVCLF